MSISQYAFEYVFDHPMLTNTNNRSLIIKSDAANHINGCASVQSEMMDFVNCIGLAILLWQVKH